MLTCLTWWWRNPQCRAQYTELHVRIWADMAGRHLSQPHRLAVVTDEDIEIEGVDIIRPPSDFVSVRIPSWPEHRPQCLRRLTMFRRDAGEIFGERFACFDLDCVISGSLDPLFDTDADFKMAIGTAPERPYNGSLIYLHAGSRPQVYETFSEAGAIEAGQKFVGSDQAWIAHCLGPDEPTWGEADGLAYHGKSTGRIMFFPGRQKPWDCLREPVVRDNYRIKRGGRCLVLGYDDELWDDVERALETGPFDAVIASPEAAEHWPGEILEVARTNRNAAELAYLHGFDDVTWCGVKEREAA